MLAAGCSARLGQAEIDGGGARDGAGSGSGSAIDAAVDAPAAACASGRVVYLNFEGDTLTQGASDATTNHAVWMGVATATVAKFRPGAADRAQQILDIVTLVQQQLTAIPEIHVVTQRPAAGPYVMIGFGDAAQTVNVPYLYAVNRLDCGDTVKSDVGWVFEATPSTTMAANFAVGAIAFGLGVTGTTDVNDCMCGWLTNCQAATTSCTLASSIQADLRCPGQTNPQNEIAALQQFCQ